LDPQTADDPELDNSSSINGFSFTQSRKVAKKTVHLRLMMSDGRKIILMKKNEDFSRGLLFI